MGEDISNNENNNGKKLKAADFKFNSNKQNTPSYDPYDLNTPFGSIGGKDPFAKGPVPNPWDQTAGDPLSGSTKKCPGCGANLVFDIEIGSMICRTCGHLYDPDTMEMNGSLGIETPEQEYGINDDIDYQDQGNKEIVCNSCGSQIVTDANTAATMCPFCGSPTLITRRLTRQFRPDAILPFSITKEKAKEAYYEHVRSVPHVPKSFTNDATVEKITGIYVPFWLLSCDVKMDIGGWTHKVMDGSPCYDPVKQENTHQHSLDVPVDAVVEFSLKNVPFDGSKKISNRLMQACEPFDYSEMVPYNASYLASTSFLAEKYDCQPKDMYDYIRKRLDNYCHQVAETVKFEDCDAFTYNSTYTGITYKNYRVIYCLLPIWFLNVKHEDLNYQFAINGQTGEVCGVVPHSRGWDTMRNMAERLNNLTHSMNRSSRNLLYTLPGVLLGILMASIRNANLLTRTGVTFLVTLVIIYLLSIIFVGVLPPYLVKKDRERSAFSSKDPHNLDKAPDASYYLDTSRKITASKRITDGGENGIVNPKAAMYKAWTRTIM